MGKPIQPLVLDRHWNVSALLGETCRLYWRHATLLVPLAVLAVVPPLLLVHLVWGEDVADWGLATGSVAGIVVPVLLTWILMPALAIAFIAVALVRIAAGERPSIAEVVRKAAPRLPAAVGTTALQVVAILAGLVALVVPGVYAVTVLWFGPQAAVAEGHAPVAALRRSAELVQGRWWQTSGRLLLTLVVAFVALMPAWVAFDSIDYGIAYVALDVFTQLVVLSFVELFATLLFLVLRVTRTG